MVKYILTITISTVLFLTACRHSSNKQDQTTKVITSKPDTLTNIASIVYESENLIVRKISTHVYEHTSFLNTESFGKVPCNGMIVVNDNEAIVFDTPAENVPSQELINYFTKKMTCSIIAVIATHFHADCVGGLNKFHEYHIPSFAYNRTIELLKNKNDKSALPQNSFDDRLELNVGDKKVYAEFFGEGHTTDNIIGYFPEDKVMFGGCLIKEKGAGKGNLEDANVNVWSETVRNIKQKYPQTKIVIPGHGKLGGTELFDYTMHLFE